MTQYIGQITVMIDAGNECVAEAMLRAIAQRIGPVGREAHPALRELICQGYIKSATLAACPQAPPNGNPQPIVASG